MIDGMMYFGQFLLSIKNTPVTEDNIDEALKIQDELDSQGKPHKAIGDILVDMGVITKDYLNECLELQDALNKIDFASFLLRINKK